MTHRSDFFLVPQHLKGVLRIFGLQGLQAPSQFHGMGPWTSPRSSFAATFLGTLHVNILATAGYAILSQFFSPCPHDHGVGIDAFSCVWNGWDSNYLFPPFHLLPEVVGWLTSFRWSGFLIAPLLPSASWFSLLLARCPHRLRLREVLFLPGDFRRPYRTFRVVRVPFTHLDF